MVNPFCSRAPRLTLNACWRLSHTMVLNCIKAYRKHIVPEGFLHKFCTGDTVTATSTYYTYHVFAHYT
jgi:hypothetical protein